MGTYVNQSGYQSTTMAVGLWAINSGKTSAWLVVERVEYRDPSILNQGEKQTTDPVVAMSRHRIEAHGGQ